MHTTAVSPEQGGVALTASTRDSSESDSTPTRPEQGNQWRWERVEKAFGHPLVLLLVTAAVSGLLIPHLTQQWQEQQQQVTIRRDFAARASRIVGEMFIATQLAQVGAQSQSQEDFDAAYVRWEVESSVLSAELRAYYPAERVHVAWHNCGALTTAYYTQAGIADPIRRDRYLEEIRQELHLPADVDLTDSTVLRAEVLRARDDAIRHILREKMI
jgi:hypothetical protein